MEILRFDGPAPKARGFVLREFGAEYTSGWE